MAKEPLIENLKEHLKGQDFFTREELHEFFLKSDPDLKETTFRWRIYDLKDKQVIRSVSKNQFSFLFQPVFIPVIEPKLKTMYREVRNEFPHVKVSIWNTKWVNHLMLHQPGKFLTIIEIENEAKGALFNYMKDKGHRNIYLDPGKKEMENYISGNPESTIISGLISKSPTITENNVIVPTLEKILIDLFSNPILFNTFQGNELVIIFENAFRNYEVNTTRLYNYAKRRHKQEDLAKFLLLHSLLPMNDLL